MKLAEIVRTMLRRDPPFADTALARESAKLAARNQAQIRIVQASTERLKKLIDEIMGEENG